MSPQVLERLGDGFHSSSLLVSSHFLSSVFFLLLWLLLSLVFTSILGSLSCFPHLTPSRGVEKVDGSRSSEVEGQVDPDSSVSPAT